MTLIDGRGLAAAIRERTGRAAAALTATGRPPTLAALVATDDAATDWYVRSIARAAAETGIELRRVARGADDAAAVLDALDELSGDRSVHGIICLTPLPAGLALASAGAHIDPAKDVDGANPTSLGRLAAGLDAFAPATARAVIELLDGHGTTLEGAEAVVVGRSTVVGKPLALLLLERNATVTVCHSRTPDLPVVTRRAEVLVAAAGRARLIGANHVRPGAVVIDVGTNASEDGGLVGDVDTDAVAEVAAAVSPVPGGVGPVTTALLLANVVEAARAAPPSA